MSCRRGIPSRAPLLALLLAGVMAAGLGGCGRRGQPEPPSSTAAQRAEAGAPRTAAGARSSTPPGDARPQAGALATSPGSNTRLTVDDDEVDEDPNAGVSPQPVPTTSRRRPRPYEKPKVPFVLDPLL